MDGEIAGAASLIASVRTTTGKKVVWQVHIEKRLGAEMWADFPDADILQIEAAYASEKRPVILGTPGEDTWTIDLEAFVQINDTTSTARPIRRVVVLNEK